MPRRRYMVEWQDFAPEAFDSRVLEAMLQVPRHEFVPAELRAQAYEDGPLSIGEGQTISQPLIIAISLQALALDGSVRYWRLAPAPATRRRFSLFWRNMCIQWNGTRLSHGVPRRLGAIGFPQCEGYCWGR